MKNFKQYRQHLKETAPVRRFDKSTKKRAFTRGKNTLAKMDQNGLRAHRLKQRLWHSILDLLKK